MLDWFTRWKLPPTLPPEHLVVGARQIPLLMVRHPRARRYLLRLQSDGTARVTLPRGGSLGEARQFVARNIGWLERQLQRLDSQSRKPAAWTSGVVIFFRGERVRIEAGESGSVNFADQVLSVSADETDLRPAIERHLRKLATVELPLRVMELAAVHGLKVGRVNVRNQHTRWGSCSRRGTISLNWRLIQSPEFVRDYICLHELAHLREMNHSGRFWREVERLCPGYQAAERWLKKHAGLLR